jgi:hypothetical protein
MLLYLAVDVRRERLREEEGKSFPKKKRKREKYVDIYQ